MFDKNKSLMWGKKQISVKIHPHLIDERYDEKSKLQFCKQMAEYLNIMYQIDNTIVELDETIFDISVYCNYHENIALIKKLISYTIKQQRFPFFSYLEQAEEEEEIISNKPVKVLINPNSIDNKFCVQSKLKICQQLSVILNHSYQMNEVIVALDWDIEGIKIESSHPDQVNLIKGYLNSTLKNNEFSFFRDDTVLAH